MANYCSSIVNQPIVFETKNEGYFLTKRYSHQPNTLSWYDGYEFQKIKDIFKNTRLVRKESVKKMLEDIDNDKSKEYCLEPESILKDNLLPICEDFYHEPWLIEIAFRSEGDYLTISEDGVNNRPWTEYELELINTK